MTHLSRRHFLEAAAVSGMAATATGLLAPEAVWTGSFNLTKNASEGFENAVEIHSPVIAGAYLDEFALMALMSEPMNWTSAAPDPHGLGTVFVPRRTRR